VSRLGSTVARLKLKGIDGGPHKRWSMWFNSTQREEPYLGLNGWWYGPERARTQVSWEPAEVLHGCRQLVS
jgi:hypothetical protein